MEEIQMLGKIDVTPVCIHTCMVQDGGSSYQQRYGLVLSGYEGRRGQETGGEC